MFTAKVHLNDTVNGIRVEEHEHTIYVSMREPVHLTLKENAAFAAALVLSAASLEDRGIVERKRQLETCPESLRTF
jgi:hypothetical protein